MGLREALQKATVAAFNGIGDIPESVTFRSMASGAPTYDPSVGEVTESYTDYTVLMVFTNVSTHEVGAGALPFGQKTGDNIYIQSTDMWALIPQSNLTPTPKIIDVIIRSSVQMKIVDIRTDPAAALWKFLVRRG